MDAFILGIVCGIVFLWMFIKHMAATVIANSTRVSLAKKMEPVPVKVELINGVFYLWSIDRNEFLAQGATAEEIVNHLEKTMVDIHIHVVEGEPDVVRKLKFSMANKKLDQV